MPSLRRVLLLQPQSGIIRNVPAALKGAGRTGQALENELSRQDALTMQLKGGLLYSQPPFVQETPFSRSGEQPLQFCFHLSQTFHSNQANILSFMEIT